MIDSDYNSLSLVFIEIKALDPQEMKSRFLQRAADAINYGWQSGALVAYHAVIESKALQTSFEG